MKKVIFFIDGFNIYHAIKDIKKYQYKWLDLEKLAKCFVKRDEEIAGIYYFTALAHWNPDKVKKHRNYIKALETVNVRPIYGQFKRREKKCPKCKRKYWTHEEKQTDVNIAINLFKLSIEDKYDKAFIISGDSDLIPSIKAVRESFPTKQIGVIVPIGRSAIDLKNNCNFHMKLKEKHLKSCIFPESIRLEDNTVITCPSTWK
jgi:uncharacterized LabA/DUF88 family protein